MAVQTQLFSNGIRSFRFNLPRLLLSINIYTYAYYIQIFFFFFTKLRANRTVTRVHRQNFNHGFDLNCVQPSVLYLWPLCREKSIQKFGSASSLTHAMPSHGTSYTIYYMEGGTQSFHAVNYNKYLWYKFRGIRSIRG